MCLITSLALGLGATATSIGASLGATGGAATALGVGALTVGELAVGSALVGGVVNTFGSMQQAQEQQEQAEYQAAVAEQNANLAARRAENIQLEGNQKRLALLRNAQQQQGTARAGYGAAGVVLGAGTTADYEADVWDAYDLDKRNMDYDIASAAWQQQVAASGHRQQAEIYRSQADSFGNKKTMSLLSGAFSTIGDTIGTGVKVGTAIGKLA